MEMMNFPFCCTAKIVYDFGGTDVSDRIHEGNEENIRVTLQGYLNRKRSGTLIVAITNSDQKAANKVLRELKFHHSKWMSKSQHRETKIRLWWKQAQE